MPASILAADPAVLIARHTRSPVELARAVLDRIAARDGAPQHHDGRRPRGRARDRRKRPTARHPYGLPDDDDTAGIRTTAASRARWENVPATGATLHARLQAASAILIG